MYKLKNLKKSNWLFIVLVMMAGLYLLGCHVEVKPKKKTSGDSSNSDSDFQRSEKETEFLSNGVKLTIVGQEIYRYLAKIEWPREVENVCVYINDQFAFKADSREVNSYLVGLDHDHNYHLVVYSQKTASTEKVQIAEWALKTPLDVLLTNGELEPKIAGHPKVEIDANRLFIPKGDENTPSFISHGREIIIRTNKLIADDGLIATFPKNQKAPMDQLGRDGGRFTIKAQSAQGKLSFIFFGEEGGDGSNGKPWVENLQEMVRLGGCDSEYRRGGRGQNGRAGGRSGKLLLEIAEAPTDFFHLIDLIGGSGGKPGIGGPGNQRVLCKRRFSDRYPLGTPIGPKGFDGVSEGNGAIEDPCISIGKGFGLCV